MVSLIGFPTKTVTSTLEDLRKHTRGVFGANFLIPEIFVPDLEEIREPVEAASKLARVVEFFYHKPEPSLVKIVHDGGALAFLASWLKAGSGCGH